MNLAPTFHSKTVPSGGAHAAGSSPSYSVHIPSRELASDGREEGRSSATRRFAALRTWQNLTMAVTLFLAVAAPAIAQDEKPQKAKTVDECLDKAVSFLLTRQHKCGIFTDHTDNFNGDLQEWRELFRAKKVNPPRHSTAYTSLSIMALASLGNQPSDSTPEGKAMSRALDYILEDRVCHEKYFGKIDHSRMYGHGIATLMLTEMCGMGKNEKQDRLIRKRCEDALNLILSAQRIKKSDVHRGGWRYHPHSPDSDLSVTVWQLLALRSARNAGFTVPKKAIDEAIAYLQICYNSERDINGKIKNHQTGFCYHKGRSPEFATTAAGLLALQVCGGYEYDEVKASSRYLLTDRLTPEEHFNWFYYGIYYYAQGMAQRGGQTASQAREITESLLLKIQKENGSFKGRGEESSQVYSTTMAILSLSIQHHYLPIYQR